MCVRIHYSYIFIIKFSPVNIYTRTQTCMFVCMYVYICVGENVINKEKLIKTPQYGVQQQHLGIVAFVPGVMPGVVGSIISGKGRYGKSPYVHVPL